MKTGLSVNELAAEILRQQNTKRDFLVPTNEIIPSTLGTTMGALEFGNYRVFIKDVAHDQIAEHTKIPKPYYNRMLNDAPELWRNNVKTWFDKYPAVRMVRTMDNLGRAFLSDRFKNTGLEYADFAEAALPALNDIGAVIMSASITDRFLYIKAVDPRIKADIPTGRKFGDGSHMFFDTVSPAVILRDSEVGLGSALIDYGVYHHVCTNLAAYSRSGMRHAHVGRKLEGGNDFEAQLSDETKAAKDKALWLEIRDTVRLAFDHARWQAQVEKLQSLTQQKIEGDVTKVVEVTAEKLKLSNDQGKSVLKHLIEGGDLTRYGLFNAVTRTSQDADNYDRATELEYAGGELIDLPASEWKQLALAA